jgi:TRAP-type C4-dicarboxylate transport system substrate-binding protein
MEVRAPEDLEGVKIMASTELAEVMDSIGAAPMSLIVTEWYLSLDRGLIDAMWMNWGGFYDLKCWEFLDHNTVFPSGVSMGMVELIMNMDTWNSLSPESQKAFDDLSLWATERVRQLEEIDKTNMAIEDLKSKGHHFVTLTPEEESVWFEAAQPVIESFIAKGESQGLPSRAVYEEVLRLAGH